MASRGKCSAHALVSWKFINIRIRPVYKRGVRVASRIQFRNKGKILRGTEKGRESNGEKETEREGERTSATMVGRLTAGRGLCAPRVISNVPGCRDSTLMERVALTPAFARQARRSSGGPRARGYASFGRHKWKDSRDSLPSCEKSPVDNCRRWTKYSFLRKDTERRILLSINAIIIVVDWHDNSLRAQSSYLNLNLKLYVSCLSIHCI